MFRWQQLFPCAVIPACSGGVCVCIPHPDPLLDKQFLTIYSSVLPLCHLLLYVLCPICRFHPSSLTPILSPSRLWFPPPLVLFLFPCRMQRDQLCLAFCKQVELIWLQFLNCLCAVIPPGAQVNMLMEAVRIWCCLPCPWVPDTLWMAVSNFIIFIKLI